jgi:hypothetical protein
VCRHRACTNDQRRSPPIALLKAWLARALPGPGITSAKCSLGPTAPTESLRLLFRFRQAASQPIFPASLRRHGSLDPDQPSRQLDQFILCRPCGKTPFGQRGQLFSRALPSGYPGDHGVPKPALEGEAVSAPRQFPSKLRTSCANEYSFQPHSPATALLRG